MKRDVKREIITSLVLAVFCVILLLLPRSASSFTQNGTREKAVVLTVDNSHVTMHGHLKYGPQNLTVRLKTGEHKGKVFQASNEMRAQLELDKEFKIGDLILVNMQKEDTPEKSVLIAQEHDRSVWFWILAAAFCAALCIFGGWTGVKALLSFVVSCLVIWKVMLPLVLKGCDPIWISFICVCLLTAIIQFLIAGLNRRGVTAFLGAIAGVFAGTLTAYLFTLVMKINGAVLPYSQALLYSGYETLNLQNIFIGAIILGCSGAVMDLAMDISTGMNEIVTHSPEISRKKLVASGMAIGRNVVGTMTTTLLLAYSGGYITLLMMFYVQGNHPLDFINNPLVASESVKTLVGSFALVLVAPLSAVAGGFFLKKNQKTDLQS